MRGMAARPATLKELSNNLGFLREKNFPEIEGHFFLVESREICNNRNQKMNAYYLTPSGLQKVGASDHAEDARHFSQEDTDIPFVMHERIPNPLPTPCGDTKTERNKTKALLDHVFGPGGGEFQWHTHKGKSLKPKKMATPHLFYALRMVWNGSVPPIWKVGDGPNYSDVPMWNKEYKRLAIEELAAELVSRDDAAELEPDLRTQFHEMILKTLTILQLGL